MRRGIPRERAAERPAAVVAVCVIDWLVLAGLAAVCAIASRAGGAGLPPFLQAALGAVLVVCLLVAALDFACFLMQTWALWVRLTLQVLTFVMFLLSPDRKTPVEWALHVLILLCWIAALVETQRAKRKQSEWNERLIRSRPGRIGRR